MTQPSLKREIIYRCAGQWGLDNIDDFTFEGEQILFTRIGEVVMSLTKESFWALIKQTKEDKFPDTFITDSCYNGKMLA